MYTEVKCLPCSLYNLTDGRCNRYITRKALELLALAVAAAERTVLKSDAIVLAVEMTALVNDTADADLDTVLRTLVEDDDWAAVENVEKLSSLAEIEELESTIDDNWAEDEFVEWL